MNDLIKDLKARRFPNWSVILLIIFFYPIGLVMLWSHSEYDAKRKRNWTFAWLGYMVLMLLPVFIIGAPAANRGEKYVNQANQLWIKGEKEAALSIYRLAIEDSIIPDAYKPIVYGRLIDQAVSNGNNAEAKAVLEDFREKTSLLMRHIPDPICNTPKGKKIVLGL